MLSSASAGRWLVQGVAILRRGKERDEKRERRETVREREKERERIIEVERGE